MPVRMADGPRTTYDARGLRWGQSGIMDRTRLFLDTLEELHERLNASRPHDVLRSAVAIRQLLLDPIPLAHQVNRDLRVRLRFLTQELHPQGGPGPHEDWWAAESLDPHMAWPPQPLRQSNLDAFLAITVGKIHGQEYTVGEVIKFVAHVMGGAHAGVPSPKEERLVALIDSTPAEGMNLPLLALRSIGRITLDALRSLQWRARGLDRFESAPGMSAHLIVKPVRTKEVNWILDICDGSDDDHHFRVSLFIDGDGRLTLRHTNAGGTSDTLHAGQFDYAISYDRPVHIYIEIGVRESETLISLKAGSWLESRLVPSSTLPRDLYFVLGANHRGQGLTAMAMLTHVLYSRVLNADEHGKLRSYFHRRMGDASGCVRFRGGQHMVSKGHPHFPGQGAGAEASST